MRIAVDVMGGDHGCRVVIEGVKRALEADSRISALYLVGNRSEIHAALPPRGFRDHRVRVVHASEVLTMAEKPAAALRKKKDCSIARAVELAREGKVDAVISLGNTGGIFAAATFKLGRIPGVDRGCIATVIPAPDHEFVLLDAGANIECKPLHLAHYAVMGSIYSREILGYKNPRVGILSIGTEDTKGNELTLEAFRLCKLLDLNFIGVAPQFKFSGHLSQGDALQTGDRPDYDGLLEFFPIGFHEPYFGTYLSEDFVTLLGNDGLGFEGSTLAFLSKVMVFRKEMDR